MNKGGSFNLKFYKDPENKVSIELNSVGFTKKEIIDLLSLQINRIEDAHSSQYLVSDRCIVCGEIIPEGRQVCKKCDTL